MSITRIQAYYYAWMLSHTRSAIDASRLEGAVSNTKIDLNPHQIDAALFAFDSPLSKGAILADEVGLGKTIEAGILLCQKWAESRRHLLVIAPASLRTQWRDELWDKFRIPAEVLESGLYETRVSKGCVNPLDSKSIVIVSYDFARRHAAQMAGVPWDLVVLDEAHKLRNVYKRGNVTGRLLKQTLAPFRKILLTATPLQNNLKELYGLVSIVDDCLFSDLSGFSARYNPFSIRDNSTYGNLKYRLQSVIHRTLRRQVAEYVKYTHRVPITVEYELSEEENDIYRRLSDYVDSPFSAGISGDARHLLALLTRKILSSSPYALSCTLKKIIGRLESEATMTMDNDDYDEMHESEQQFLASAEYDDVIVSLAHDEISRLTQLVELIDTLPTDTKAESLLKALEIGFGRMNENGALRKALIFTESTRTQYYLQELLKNAGYRVAVFNGTNNTQIANEIYSRWKSSVPTAAQFGVAAVDKRKAIVDYFMQQAEILIATEAGAEGINLQFCSLVINYDLPWNPQRIEQRIGRCHRYGQRHDVVVINFVNRSNHADVRVFELLNDKFRLFDGVLGASDEIIGAVESTIDFEKRIEEIYRSCRSLQEIDGAFDTLQSELDEIIRQRVEDSRKHLIERFDENIISRFNGMAEGLHCARSRRNTALWQLVVHSYADDAECVDYDRCRILTKTTTDTTVAPGWYGFNAEDAFPIRWFDGIGRGAIKAALMIDEFEKGVEFRLSEYTRNKAAISSRNLTRGRTLGYRVCYVSEVEAFESFIFCCFDVDGTPLPAEVAESMMDIPAYEAAVSPVEVDESVMDESVRVALRIQHESLNNGYESVINMQIDRIKAYAADVLAPMEDELMKLRSEVAMIKRRLRHLESSKERLALTLERTRKERLLRSIQQDYYAKRDECDADTEEKLQLLQASLNLHPTIHKVFDFTWVLT